MEITYCVSGIKTSLTSGELAQKTLIYQTYKMSKMSKIQELQDFIRWCHFFFPGITGVAISTKEMSIIQEMNKELCEQDIMISTLSEEYLPFPNSHFVVDGIEFLIKLDENG